MLKLLMHLIGLLASFPAVIVALFIFINDLALFFQLTVGVIVLTILIFLLRIVFKKERPNIHGMKKSFFQRLSKTKLKMITSYLEDIEKRSFASAHVARVVVFGVVLYFNNFSLDYVIGLGVFAIIMAISRLYVKRHVFIDVITGSIIGGISGYFGYYVFNHFYFQFI